MKLSGSELNFRNKKVTIMGLGLHGGGVSASRFLAQRGAHVCVTDLRPKKILLPSIKLLKKFHIQYILGRHRLKDFKNADCIIKNPGVPNSSLYLSVARKKGIPIETDVSLFLRMCHRPIIGITGTKGKSTTTSLINHILIQAHRYPLMAGNIRISPLDILEKVSNRSTIILELSSWQLEDIQFLHQSPKFAVITNVLPDHLNRYQSMNDYVKSKKIILQFQTKDDYSILNYDNPITRKFKHNVRGQLFWFSRYPLRNLRGVYIKDSHIISNTNGYEQKICHIKNIQLIGIHNQENALAAITVATIFKTPASIIGRAISTFHGIPGRLEKIRTWHGRQFINDTAATTPEAAIAALHSVPGKKILIAGGADKHLDYENFSKEINRRVAFCVLFHGSATKKIIGWLKKLQYNHFTLVKTMNEAVTLSVKNSKPNDSILLSPGAASFGIFLNEFDRGDQFNTLVGTI